MKSRRYRCARPSSRPPTSAPRPMPRHPSSEKGASRRCCLLGDRRSNSLAAVTGTRPTPTQAEGAGRAQKNRSAHRRTPLAAGPAELDNGSRFPLFRVVFFHHWLSPHITPQHNSHFGKTLIIPTFSDRQPGQNSSITGMENRRVLLGPPSPAPERCGRRLGSPGSRSDLLAGWRRAWLSFSGHFVDRAQVFPGTHRRYRSDLPDLD